jgi:tripartite ATP-independent transporter DctM subunit
MTTWYVLVPFIILFIAFLTKMPLGFGMIIGAIAYLFFKGQNVGMLVNTICYSTYTAYILIAIPLFVFTANIMNSTSITKKLFNFCTSVIGGKRGATGYVNVLASLIFAGMTGSALADAAGLGIIEIRQMENEGYDKPFSCAITAATAVLGPIFPPSIPLVIYAMITGASVGKLFLGGMIPAFLIAILFMIYVYFISKKRNYPCTEKLGFSRFVANTIPAIPALFTPVLLLIGIYTGVMTPTEAAAVAGAYVLLISFMIYRSIDFKTFSEVLFSTIRTVGSLILIIAGAYCLSYIVTVEKIDMLVSDFFQNTNLSRASFLFLVNVLFLFLGCAVDVNVSQLVFLPIFTPLLSYYEIDPIHFGVVITLNMMIGLLTPPFGMLLFVTSSIGNCPMKDLIKEVMPLVIVLIASLVIITIFPQSVLFFTRFIS